MHGLQLVKNCRDDPLWRRSFNALTRKTYGFDFEDWYRLGCWGDSFVPYALADGGRIVANVSVSFMRLVIDGAFVNAVQLGTVMTDEAYRGRGLSRDLMEIILAEYEDRCDFIYLFANGGVLDFYPRFGFERAAEYECAAEPSRVGRGREFRKLDVLDARDRAVFFRLVERSVPQGRIGCLYDTGLVMFYCAFAYRDGIFYFPGEDFAAVAGLRDGTLRVEEVFAGSEMEPDEIAGALSEGNENRVAFGFTPKAPGDRYVLTPKAGDSDALFIRSKRPLELPKAMFPVLSRT
jgi:GNAT superfamily N-acetyltransferase